MKILHINFSDKSGGAAIAAYRHNEALNRAGYDSRLLVLDRLSSASSVIEPPEKKSIIRIKSILYSVLSSYKTKKYKPYATFSTSAYGFNLAQQSEVKGADVILIHWVNGGMLSVKGVEQILRLGKPVIWFLHDMWPMTGGCHYSFSCTKYQNHCHTCFLLNDKNGSTKYKDITYRLFEKKLKRWGKFKNLSIVAPSQWLADAARSSRLFKHCNVNVFRNVIDTELYRPIDKSIAREILNLPQKKKLILFGADSISSPYKGWSYLRDALNKLNSQDVECVVFGNVNRPLDGINSNIKINYIGRLNDDYSLVLLYNACDVFVTPSIADNFPNVILEAMSCGLPSVGFNIGGIPEMIQHEKTGIIAEQLSGESLAEAITQMLNKADIIQFSQSARKWVEENASYKTIKKNIENII